VLDALAKPKYRAIVLTTYGSGLRIREACGLQVQDIDSKRMVLHIRAAKGGGDRYVPLPERVLFMLRRYWVATRPQGPFLFPGKEPGRASAPTPSDTTCMRPRSKPASRRRSLRTS
jgi:integrase/recombinase XerD